MAVNGVEIKVGQTWRQRGGVTVDITEKSSGTRYVWLSSCCESYDDDGRVWSDEMSDEDLIELIIRPETVPFPTIDAHSDASESLVKKLSERTSFAVANPKDAIGSTKLPLHLWPAEATAIGCLGMLEGKEKYGRNNYVAGDGVVASIYIDAAKRHIDAWFSGEEVSPDTLNDHLGNALACLAIIVKTRAHGKLIDDRDFAPNAGYRKLVEELTPNVKRLQQLFADKSPRHFTIGDNK